MKSFLGQVISFAGSFAPKDWAFCHGQVLNIAENQELFTVLGSAYGGDGVTTFALPDCRGRVILGAGKGVGLTNYPLALKGGKESVALSLGQMPTHNHNVNAVSATGTSNHPSNKLLSNTASFDYEYSSGIHDVQFSDSMIENSGNGEAHENRQPFMALNVIICLCGEYPFRASNCPS